MAEDSFRKEMVEIIWHLKYLRADKRTLILNNLHCHLSDHLKELLWISTTR
jgi:hypothetical protein